MLIVLLIFIALSAFFAIMYLIERKRRHTFSKYLDKIAVSIGEEAGTPPLYIYERLRKRIEELQNGILESEKERKNVFTILNNITDPIIIVRGDGVVTFANIAGRDITRPGIEGRKVYEILVFQK